MKKKLWFFIFALLFILPCTFVLTACGEKDPPTNDDGPPASPPGSTEQQYGIWVNDMSDMSSFATVTLSTTQAKVGETVNISYTTEPGYKIKYFYIEKTYQDENGEWCSETVDVVYDSFVMPDSNVEVYPKICKEISNVDMTFEYDAPTDSYALTGWGWGFERIVPATYDDGVHGVKNVTIIREDQSMVYMPSNITVIRLPETITTIENEAFSLSSTLISVNIPSSVTNLYDYTAENPVSLNVQEVINNSSFDIRTYSGDCVTKSSLYKTSDSKAYFLVGDTTVLMAIKSEKNMVFPSSGTILQAVDDATKTITLGDYEVYDWYNTDDEDVVETITLGKGAVRVPKLKYGPMLHEVTFNDGLKEFGEMFEYFSKIETLTIPDSLEIWAGSSCFNKIKNIVIGANSKLKSYGEIFINNNLMHNEYEGGLYLPSEDNDYFILAGLVNPDATELSIHPNCKIIGSINIHNVTELNIPASVRGISNNFHYDEDLKKITIEENSCLEYAMFPFYSELSVIYPESITKLTGTLTKWSYFQAENVELDVETTDYTKFIFYDVDRVVSTYTYSYALSHKGEAYLTYWNEYVGANDLRTVDGYPIVHIGDKVFMGNTNVSNVQLSNKLRHIGKYAFDGCSKVMFETLDIPTLEYIGEYAFHGCERIDFVKIPKGCKVGLHSLPSVVCAIEDNEEDFNASSSEDFWTDYKNHDFYTRKTYYECKTADDYLYGSYTLHWSDSRPAETKYALIKYLGASRDITPPTTLEGNVITKIAPFCYKYNLISSIDALNVNVEFEIASLYGVTTLESVKIKAFSYRMFVFELRNDTLCEANPNLTYVEANSFSTKSVISTVMPNVETIIIHNSYTSLAGCKAKNITLPYLTDFLGEVFRDKGNDYSHPGLSILETTHQKNVPSTLKNLTIIGNETAYSIYYSDDEEIGLKISEYHLRNCTNLATVVLGSKIKYVGENAFEGCTGLTRIEMLGVETIDEEAFYKCEKLKYVGFGSPLATIHFTAFTSSKNIDSVAYSLDCPYYQTEGEVPLTAKKYYYIVNTPNLDMSKLGGGWYIINEETTSYTNMSKAKVAFLGNAPSGFKQEYLAQFDADTPKELINFYENIPDIQNNGLVEYFVYDTNKARITNVLSNSVTNLSIPNLIVEIIDDGAFANSGITNITIPGTVKSIRNCAFYNCTSLINVTLSSGLEHIGYEAFKECTSLQTITIPSTVKTMDNSVFQYCTSLKSVDIQSTLLTTIPSYTFWGCSKLTSFHLPSQIKEIGGYAFYNTGITTFTGIEDSVLETIGEYALVKEDPYKSGYNNHYISIPFTSLHFPDTLISVGKRAFTYCEKLQEITFGNKIETIGEEAFYGGIFEELVLPNSLTDIGSMAFGENKHLLSYTGPVTKTGHVGFIRTTNPYTSVLTHIEITGGSTIGANCFSNFIDLETVIIGDSLWDFFYKGEYFGAVDGNLYLLSVPCFMGKMTDFNAVEDDPFTGTFQIRGKAGFTGFPMGENSLYYKYSNSAGYEYYSSYGCVDFSTCLFTDANVSLGADVHNVVMPATLTRISAEVITDGRVILSSPLSEALPSGNNYEMSITYVLGENTILNESLWNDINVVDILIYYVYTQEQYDYIKTKDINAIVFLYYTDGMTRENNVYYWEWHKNNYPIQT